MLIEIIDYAGLACITLFLILDLVHRHRKFAPTKHWRPRVGSVYLIQRPESQSVHHRRHGQNYSDLPLWDIVFGTFENPEEMEHEAGFYHGASNRVPEMLVGMDVARPEAEELEPATA